MQISQIIHNSTICGLAGAKKSELITVAQAIKPAKRGQIHTYSNINLRNQDQLRLEQELESIKENVSLAQ